jgi:DNA-binding MarR family transcriptional regulator
VPADEPGFTLNPLDNNRYNDYISVVGSLEKEIKQGKAWASREEEAFLNLLRTADALSRGEAVVLKPANLSPNQYNALRILRGAGEEGVTCSELGSRLIERDPDVTRLIDRLEERGLMRRTRDARDRRVYRNVITAAGLNLLASLDEPLAAVHKKQMGHLSPEKLATLISLLEDARSRLG